MARRFREENPVRLENAYRRHNLHRRRARLKGGGPITVTLEELGIRDGWVCVWSRNRLCLARSKVIDPELSGRHPEGATLEHLIPLSDGGTNAASNLAVSHRACNVKRGAFGTPQLHLDLSDG